MFLFCKNFNPLQRFVPCLVGVSLVVLEKKKILKFCQCISAISFLSPFGKGLGLLFEQVEFRSHKDALCHFWLKLALWFWRRR